MRRRSVGHVLLMVGGMAALVAGTVAPGGGVGLSPAGGAGQAAAEIVADDLGDVQAGMGLCGTLMEIVLPKGRVACTHGADPPPVGLDPSKRYNPAHPEGRILPEVGAPGLKTAAAGTPGIRCYGDGKDGNRTHVIYARPSNRPDRYAQVLGSIKRFTAEMDEVFQRSAQRHNAVRRVRFLTDPNCNLIVDNVVLSASGDDTLDATMTEMSVKGYDDPKRKYLVYMDSDVLCGIAAYYPDERAGQNNLNNGSSAGTGVVARIDEPCWGYGSQGESVEAHELMHSLGSVLPGAPNSTAAGHCEDDSDRMCYEDGTQLNFLFTVCGRADEALFDCQGNDYFNPSPPPGTYLSSNWNTARSTFLAADDGVPAIKIGDAALLEGDFNASEMSFSVSLTNPSAGPVSVKWATFAGSAEAGNDFTPTSGTLSFAPGQTSAPIRVPVTGDTVDEGDEILRVNLSQPVGGPLHDGQAVGTILDDDPKRKGYWMVANDGGIFAFGDAGFFGSTGAIKLNRPINGMVSTPSGNGYWMVADDGGIFAFGDAGFYGSTGDRVLSHPVIGIATQSTGAGYWLATSGGTVFAFGEAQDLGGLPSPPAAPIVGIVATASGEGYWLAGRDGRVYPFGDAPNLGSASSGRAILAMVGTPSAKGYWMVNDGGDVFAFGDAGFYGTTGPSAHPLVGIASSATGGGYWVVGNDGGLFAFGDAPYLGSMGGIPLTKPVAGIAGLRR